MRPESMRRNNMDQAGSPYLQSHADNPVWWQEWTPEVLRIAEQEKLPILVSVGYATCHWCHVMAREAFSDASVAEVLNDSFISIKIDREERPDIDHYLMSFLLATRGSGGWPLNAFLAPDGKPLAALTYIPIEARGNMPGFLSVCNQVLAFIRDEDREIPRFDLWAFEESNAPDLPAHEYKDPATVVASMVSKMESRFDRAHGGFGDGPKFPPHNTLLFLLYAAAIYKDPRAAELAQATLAAIARGGLCDHLAGGFFRYCVDSAWRIPHFEKMLYDQAMMLWVFAEAFALFDDPWYRYVAEGVASCLRDDFTSATGGLVSAHDADTAGVEGDTYLWSDDELLADEGDWVRSFFETGESSIYEGRRHLIRRGDESPNKHDRDELDRLLAIRRQRRQPKRDGKVVTAWNALTAIALLVASRRLDRPDLGEWAREIYAALCRTNRRADGSWTRSYFEGRTVDASMLEDEAAVLLLLTYFAEEEEERSALTDLLDEVHRSVERVQAFLTERGWESAKANDFESVPAEQFDSPSPAPSSLAELALQRAALLDAEPGRPLQPGSAMHADFFNLAWLVEQGEFYLLEHQPPIPWNALPINAIRYPANHNTWCFRGVCRPGTPEQWNPLPERGEIGS